MTDIVVPTLGESVTEATVAKWLKQPGESFARDEALVELETDKVSVEVPAPVAGTLGEIVAAEGATVEIGALLGRMSEGDAPKAASPAASKPPETKPETKPVESKPPEPSAPPAARSETIAAPSAQRVAAEAGVDLNGVNGTGKGGRITKGDAIAAAEAAEKLAPPPAAAKPAPSQAPVPVAARPAPAPSHAGREERVRMTRLRQTIARRLKEAQNSAAMLTTFNEVDMTAIMAVRAKYKEAFERKHRVKLGFMSFFVKACITGLQEVPEVNAEIDGEDIIYKNYYDIGIAVGSDRGLVVPVLRDADSKSIAEIEKDIGVLGAKARDGALKIEDLQGATFTISNGGVYGSLMSTPILNAPQSGILGMHKIQDRPIVVDGQIAIRPMMYLALSYDHRLVDGKAAVTFLVRVKENLEDPERTLLGL